MYHNNRYIVHDDNTISSKFLSHDVKNYHQFCTMHGLKVVSATFLLVYFVCLKESTCETRGNVFHFSLKGLFVLEMLTFQVFKCHDVIKCLSLKHETHFAE